MPPSTSTVRLVGLLMVGVLAGAIGLAAAFYTQAFVSRVPVVLRTDRTGLIMDAGNSVTLRGVQVGVITDVRVTDAGAELVLGLDPAEIRRIPADVTARIEPSTVFGAKNVSLEQPPMPSTTRIAAGAVLDNRQVTVEVNTVFENLATLLRQVDAAKINVTLGELAKALDGRGDQIADLASTATDYLERINGKLPVLQKDLHALRGVTDVVADAAPDGLRILDNLTVTGSTVVEQADQLDGFLLDIAVLAGNGQQVLAENHEDLATSMALLRSPLSLLHEYEPGLGCFIEGLDETRRLLEPAVGGASPEVRLNTTISLGREPYQAPRDLPEIAADNGPACHGLPYLDESERPSPYLVTDTGARPNKAGSGPSGPQVGAPIAPLLTGPLSAAAGEEGE
jgi:phospholipid/cholesterol/gamma-HCH transport system substrate-binding protein